MPISEDQLYEMLARLEKNSGRAVIEKTGAVENEIDEVHEPILAWARSFIPFVPVIYHRPDKKSGLRRGVNDLTVLYKKHTLLIEGKSKKGKIRPEQLVWALACENQGFKVHVITSPEEFFKLIAEIDAL